MKFRKKAYRLRAVTGVLIASMLGLFIVMLGWAMDTSYVAYVVQQLQVAADAAALAGAAEAKTDLPLARLRAQATGAANTAGMTASVPDPVLLELNEANLPDGDIVTGRFYRWDHPIEGHLAGDFVETTLLGHVNSVKAVARRTDTSLNGRLPLLFGPIFGVDTTEVSRDAIAMVGGATGAGLIVLCPDCECALDFSGTTQLTLANAPGYTGESIIQVNSDASGCMPNRGALCADGNAVDITAPGINLVAKGPESYCLSGLDESDVPPINPGMPYIPDPLAGLPEPDYLLMPDRDCIGGFGCSNKACVGGLDDGFHCNSNDDCPGGACGVAPKLCHQGDNADQVCTSVPFDCPNGTCVTTIRVRPGYYSGGIRITSSTLKLVLESGVYSLDHTGIGPDSGLVVTAGNFDASAGVMLHIVNDGVVYLGGNGTIIVNPIEDETNIYNGVSIFQSRTNFQDATIIGTDDMLLDGTYYFPHNKLIVGGEGLALGNQLLTWELDMHGTGTYTILYDGENPAPGYKVWLVK